MSKAMLTAAALMAVTSAIHVFAGGRDVEVPLLAAMPSAELTLYVYVLWHFVTLCLTLGAAALLLAGLGRAARAYGVATGVVSLGCSALFLVTGLTVLGEPWTAPQWVIFLVIGTLALWPDRRLS